MLSFALLPIFAVLGHALPQDSCQTVTSELIVPTTTATYSSTFVVTEHPTTAKDLGTFTEYTTLSSTKTLQTLTSYASTCLQTDLVSVPFATVTVYSSYTKPANLALALSSPVGLDSSVALSSSAYPSKRALGLNPRDGCTVTVTSTTTYGQTHTYVPASRTSTYWDYTTFTQATITSTKTGGKAYTIATGYATTSTKCGDATVTASMLTATVTLDPRCSPSAMTSAYNGYGIEWLSDTPQSGATYETNTTDSSSCCQLCAEAEDCAASAWDIRTGACKLEFPVDFSSGEMNCGEGLLGYYDAGPNHPMSPGTGWYIAEVCGNAEFGSAKPDDGT